MIFLWWLLLIVCGRPRLRTSPFEYEQGVDSSTSPAEGTRKKLLKKSTPQLVFVFVFSPRQGGILRPSKKKTV